MKVSNNYFGNFNGALMLCCGGQNDEHILNNDSFNWILEEDRGDLLSDFALHKKANL